MSTRAVYFFVDPNSDRYAVYKHHDGYPSGVAQWIEAARTRAWEGDRFEADEAAASFVAANKTGPGGVRLMRYSDWDVCPPDIDYAYEIRPGWKVTAYEVLSEFFDDPAKKNVRKIWSGDLAAMSAWADEYEKEPV